MGGVEYDPRTVKKHMRDDANNTAVAGSLAARLAIDEENDRIASYITASTLSNDVSSVSMNGGRAWNRRAATADDLQTRDTYLDPCSNDNSDDFLSEHSTLDQSESNLTPSSSHPPRPPSNREREKSALETLSAFADRVKSFRQALFYNLRPGQAVTPELLRSYRRDLRSLRNSLQELTSTRHNVATVLSSRDSLREELQDLERVLKDMEDVPHPPVHAAHYDACKLNYLIVLISHCLRRQKRTTSMFRSKAQVELSRLYYSWSLPVISFFIFLGEVAISSSEWFDMRSS